MSSEAATLDAPTVEARRPRGWRRPGWRSALPVLVTLPPALWMAHAVLGGSRLPYEDYWIMAHSVFEPSGGLDIGNLLSSQNEHVVVIPDLLYWLNARITGGSNIVLGLVIVAVVIGQLAVVRSFVPPARRRTAVGLGLLAVAGILVFSRQSAHLYFAAYSAPIANLLAVGAIAMRARGRTSAAIGLGFAASISNGAGLAVWPALVVVGMVSARRWRPAPSVVVFGALTGLCYQVLRDDPGSTRQAPFEVVQAVAELLGALVSTSATVDRAAGAAGIVVAALLVRRLLPARSAEAAPWVGVVVYAVGAAGIIAAARANTIIGLDLGVEGRYTSVSALFLIGLLGLAAMTVRYGSALVIPLVVVAVAVVPLGQDEIDRFVATEPAQTELAAALRLDLADGQTYLPFYGYPRVAPTLAAFGHYPFDGAWDGDCGLEGQQLARVPRVDPDDGLLAAVGRLDNGRGLRFSGTIPPEDVGEVDCVLIVDWANRVVGFGAAGVEIDVSPVPAERTFAAVAPVGSPSFSAYLVLDGGILRHLAGDLDAPVAPG